MTLIYVKFNFKKSYNFLNWNLKLNKENCILNFLVDIFYFKLPTERYQNWNN
jgi:hypothetical protein